MTVEEIKSQYSMRDILSRYGMQANRAGFCHCPFHKGDREPSMKVYEKDFHCYACGANGDIFTFVQRMDALSFRDAFLSLGGSYEKSPSFSARAAIYKAKKARQTRQRAQERLAKQKVENNTLITRYRDRMESSTPLSEEWSAACKALEYQLYVHGELNGIPYGAE